MEVTQAILERRSIRAYLPQPVPHEVVVEIIEKALWSPSATNIQAWSLTVVSGKARQELSEALVEISKIDHEGHSDFPYPILTDELMARRRAVGYKVYEAKGIKREDKARRIWWAHEMLRFFGAPTAIFIHTPRSICPYILPDTGIIAMAIMLLAAERGLGTCTMNQPVHYPEVLVERLGIPPDHAPVLAVALGYPDMSDPVNSFPREREPVSGLVRFVE